jgi:hypothetical protein
MKTRNVIAIAAFMIIAFILGVGVESSPEVPEEVEEIKSISVKAAEKQLRQMQRKASAGRK